MAKNKDGTTAEAPASGNSEQPKKRHKPPAGSRMIEGETFTYDPTLDQPLQGWLVQRRVMTGGPSADGTWIALFVENTVALQARKGGPEGDVVDVPAGSRLLVACTAKLKEFGMHATHADKEYEGWMAPVEKIKLDKGRSMWVYDVALTGKSRARTIPLIVDHGPAGRLPPADANGASQADDIPF